MRTLIGAALALTLVVTTASAFIRLTQAGLSCRDWPACYGQGIARAPSEPRAKPALAVARAVHRIAASTIGLLIVALAALAWNRYRGVAHARERAASWIALGVTVFLAWLGSYTPSDVPVVVIGNLLGGMALAAVLAWLWYAERARPLPAPSANARTSTAVALVAVAFQIGLGGLISARYAALACPTWADCAAALRTPDWRAFDLFSTNDAIAASAARSVQAAHRLAALAIAAIVAYTAAMHWRAGGESRRLALVLIAIMGVQLALGAALPAADFPIVLALAHNIGAALVLLVLVGLLRESVGEVR